MGRSQGSPSDKAQAFVIKVNHETDLHGWRARIRPDADTPAGRVTAVAVNADRQAEMVLIWDMGQVHGRFDDKQQLPITVRGKPRFKPRNVSEALKVVRGERPL